MFEGGYIKLNRKILSWEWYQDITTTRLFIHLLLTVNFKESQWKDVDVPRGSRVATVPMLAKETGLTNKQVRGSLEKLNRAGNTAVKAHSKFSVISIENWDKYQAEGQDKGQTKGTIEGSLRARNRAGKGQHYKKDNNSNNIINNNACARAREDDSASRPFHELTPSNMQRTDETPEERAERIRKQRE